MAEDTEFIQNDDDKEYEYEMNWDIRQRRAIVKLNYFAAILNLFAVGLILVCWNVHIWLIPRIILHLFVADFSYYSSVRLNRLDAQERQRREERHTEKRYQSLIDQISEIDQHRETLE